MWRGTDGTRGVGTSDPLLIGPPPGPVGRPIPWANHNEQPLYIHDFPVSFSEKKNTLLHHFSTFLHSSYLLYFSFLHYFFYFFTQFQIFMALWYLTYASSWFIMDFPLTISTISLLGWSTSIITSLHDLVYWNSNPCYPDVPRHWQITINCWPWHWAKNVQNQKNLFVQEKIFYRLNFKYGNRSAWTCRSSLPLNILIVARTNVPGRCRTYEQILSLFSPHCTDSTCSSCPCQGADYFLLSSSGNRAYLNKYVHLLIYILVVSTNTYMPV